MCDHTAAVFPLAFESGGQIQTNFMQGGGLSGTKFYMFHENRQLGRDPVNACPRGRAAVSACQLIYTVGGVSLYRSSVPRPLSVGNSRCLSLAFFNIFFLPLVRLENKNNTFHLQRALQTSTN